ncbi:exopolyphosphatase / guanosine-5'-triphosphate,3'-diphosphate pyrophosphatase [Cnuella takakiae]|uniref:Exopolyphosphatase / guanosine-5'-triphosphate,3'-diphosphate pyrophosphatase n=1 Tax=Cnuella takakiae TaxID=1302690 RepID=A0A1M4VQK1_9BACT|nr:exopolyphosphatase [Cnuella takakiae]OLY92530.1 exopolyphosphatase [Cnuella takakiae]SHE71117.1 exopolyphosphatase / guanosine-5'-triphosphate,3'-diphosphate pyrophosphatase [Cnuella takakiae]
MKLGAIDIGSNAMRLLISEVVDGPEGQPEFVKQSLVRVPIRLGMDVFEIGRISEGKAEKLVQSIQAYKLLLEVYDVPHLKACATAAMRDAANGPELIERIKRETGISIEIITGQQEAAFIYENHVAENLNSDESYLYIDVGGGSTELTFFSDGKLVAKESFNIGTIRLLKDQVEESVWNEMKNFIRTKTSGYHHITAIGSGGNINKVFSLSKRKEGKPLTLELLRNYYKEFSSLNMEQRRTLYKLREDRADVIVPALLIYINVMRWADTEEIFVPKIGLADGLINILYHDVVRKALSE